MLLTGHLPYPASVHVPGLLVVFKLFRNAFLKSVVMRSVWEVHSSDMPFSLSKRVIDLDSYCSSLFIHIEPLTSKDSVSSYGIAMNKKA